MNKLNFSRQAHAVRQRGAGAGGLPARRGFTIVFSRSNQKGAPKVTAKAVRSRPKTFHTHSLEHPGIPRASAGSEQGLRRERFQPMGGTLTERKVASIWSGVGFAYFSPASAFALSMISLRSA